MHSFANFELTPKNSVLFIIGDWNAKVGSQEIPRITGKFGLGVQNKAGERLNSFAKIMYWSKETSFSNNTRDKSTHGCHQMVNTEIKLIIFFAAEALFCQQKQNLELTVAQIISSFLQNSSSN